MRVPVYCGETFEALTIIRLRPWALELLDQGSVFLPGQQSEVNEVRRDAQLAVIESALRGLGRR